MTGSETDGASTDAPSDRADRKLLEEALDEVSPIALSYFKENPEQWSKDGGSPVSEADIAVDRWLMARLRDARPDYGWLSEESTAEVERLAARRTFVIDPIDGTRAFLDGDPRWSISLAVVEAGRPVAAALAVPALSRRYSAARRQGATRDGERIESGSPEGQVAGPRGWFSKPPLSGWAHRRGPYIPSLAHRVAMVADGQLSAAFARPRASDWDLAAADLLLHEAGGRLMDVAGQPILYNQPDVRHGTLIAVGSGQFEDFHAAVRRVAEIVAGEIQA